MVAAESGSINCVYLLHKYGSDLLAHDRRGTHRTALWYAKLNYPNSDLQLLLEDLEEQLVTQSAVQEALLAQVNGQPEQTD